MCWWVKHCVSPGDKQETSLPQRRATGARRYLCIDSWLSITWDRQHKYSKLWTGVLQPMHTLCWPPAFRNGIQTVLWGVKIMLRRLQHPAAVGPAARSCVLRPFRTQPATPTALAAQNEHRRALSLPFEAQLCGRVGLLPSSQIKCLCRGGWRASPLSLTANASPWKWAV